MARTIAKVCGITRLEDARVAIESGADWIGCIVAGSSPRVIEPAAAGAIVAAFPGNTFVAVMASVDPDRALDTARAMGAQRVQLHRVDAASWPADFPIPVTFAIPVANDGSLAASLPRAGARCRRAAAGC